MDAMGGEQSSSSIFVLQTEVGLGWCSIPENLQLKEKCAPEGLYIKLGQHVGQLDHLLPNQYVATMKENLLDRCPVSSYSMVSHVYRPIETCDPCMPST
jgi:hypothetical protein